MRAMVLAAGFGTRLRPLTEELPKPAVPVLGRPLVAYTVEALGRLGVDRVVMNLHHLPEALPALLGDGSELGVTIDYVVERGEILGTGGGILGARELLDDGEPFLVVNGDVLFDLDLEAAVELHRSAGATATMILRRDPKAERYGAVDVDEGGRVRRLLGTPPFEGTLASTMFTGIHVLDPAVFDLLPKQGCIVRTAYRSLVDSGGIVCGSVDDGAWVELGTVADYLRVNLALAAGELSLAGVPGGAGCWVSADAEVDDPALLKGPVVVGAGARVRAPVERAVLWDGVVVDEPVADAVVTPRGIVRAE